MSRRGLILCAAAGSVLLLGGAFLFQALGYLPCKLCLWQRWPHGAAIALGALAAVLPAVPALLPLAGAAAAATSAGIGLYHTGVERHWWLGPANCSPPGGGLSGMSGSDLLSLDGPPLVLCDQVSWAFAGLSMASWNALLSLALAGLWLAAALRRV